MRLDQFLIAHNRSEAARLKDVEQGMQKLRELEG